MGDDTTTVDHSSDPDFDPNYVLEEVVVTHSFNLTLLMTAGALLLWGLLSD